MSAEHIKPEDLVWRCSRCNQRLIAGSVLVKYLGNNITTELPQCPSCYMVLVSEELAIGKIAEVQQILEDK